jgi:hypothetical protein
MSWCSLLIYGIPTNTHAMPILTGRGVIRPVLTAASDAISKNRGGLRVARMLVSNAITIANAFKNLDLSDANTYRPKDAVEVLVLPDASPDSSINNTYVKNALEEYKIQQFLPLYQVGSDYSSTGTISVTDCPLSIWIGIFHRLLLPLWSDLSS